VTRLRRIKIAGGIKVTSQLILNILPCIIIKWKRTSKERIKEIAEYDVLN
jgi:hypothetical protein